MTQTLSRILKHRRAEGAVIPSPFPKLDAIGAHFRRGNLSLIVGAPGRGKSAFAAHFAAHAMYDEDTGVPSLYWSMDTDKTTLGSRIAAGLRNRPITEIESQLVNDDDALYAYLHRALEHVWFTFDPGPSFADIDEEVDAYAHVQGEYPHLIVVDNLMDIYSNAEDERHAHGDAMAFLNELARRTSAHVMVLAHAKGAYENGTTPIPQGGVLNNIGKKPRLMLTLHTVQPGVMGLRVVKNSAGQADPEANFGINIPFLPDRMWFGD